MNAQQLIERLAKYTGYTVSEIDQRTRRLRDAGLLPVGGRGPHAPQINAAHAAMMCLHQVSRKATESLQIAAEAGHLKLVPVPGRPDAFFGYTPKGDLELATVLGVLIESPAAQWQSLDVASDGSMARLHTYLDGAPFTLQFRPDPAQMVSHVGDDVELYRRQGATFFAHQFSFGVGWTKQIGAALANLTEAGWGDRRRSAVRSTDELTLKSVSEIIAELNARQSVEVH